MRRSLSRVCARILASDPPRTLPRRTAALQSLEPRWALAAIDDWSVRGAGGGGALFSPSFNPVDPDELYVASDMGQVFHTTDGGAQWEAVDHRELHGSHNARVQFTSDPLIRYALDYTGDQVRPTKSTDGGVTWTRMAADPTGGEAISLAVDYANPLRVLVSDYSRLFVSTNGGATFAQRFSTGDDAGLHLAGALFDGPNIYVGANQGTLISTNGGASFAVAAYSGIPSDQRIVSWAGAKEGGVTRFWAVTAGSADVYAGIQGWDHGGYAGIYRLDVGQSAWSTMTSGLPPDVTPFYVAASLNDVDRVYVAGGSDEGRPTVYRSNNQGAWQSVLLTVDNANVATGWSGDGGVRGWWYGETALGFTVSPLDSSRVVITDYGFGHRSDDAGASWHALYVAPDDLNPPGESIPPELSYRSSGLENTTSWDLTWVDDQQMIGSFSDIRGVRSDDGGNSWSFNYDGHTQNSMYRSIVHPTTGVIYAATSTVHDMYQSTYLTDARIDGGSGLVLQSTDGGANWQTMHNFGRVVTWVEADPTNSNRLYASVAHRTEGGIYVTNNAQAGASSTWTKLANPPRTEGHAFNIRVLDDGTLVVSYSGRRDAAGAFTPSSGVFVSTNGGQSWSDRSHAGMLYWTKDVVIDPHDSTQSTWYAAVFSGWGGAANGLGGLYRTSNRGATWTRVNALDRVNSITVSPANPDEAYLTTEVEGLWHSDNLRAANPTFTQVEGYRFMQPMRVFYHPHDNDEVWVTSFGGGLRVGRATAQPGDANGDGLVTGADYTIWADHFGLPGQFGPSDGDFNSDGAVTGADYTIWADNFTGGPDDARTVGPIDSDERAVKDTTMALAPTKLASASVARARAVDTALEQFVAREFDEAFSLRAARSRRRST